jgi:hypothetical protein
MHEPESMTRRPGRLGSATLAMVGLVMLGCATPIEIKNGSRAQVDLVGAMDGAVADLQKSVSQFHQAREARIREEGRILVARQAIDAAVTGARAEDPLTADQLFTDYKAQIQTWVDYAFQGPRIEEEIARLTKRIAEERDPIAKQAMTMNLEDLEVRRASLAAKPPAVARLEKIVQDDLANEGKAAAAVDHALTVLRAQVALMKAMAARVDAWLAIDVTVTEEQADGLRQSFAEATRALGGGQR